MTMGFGYTRIIGELRKLGVEKISRQTVQNALKEAGIEPGPATLGQLHQASRRDA